MSKISDALKKASEQRLEKPAGESTGREELDEVAEQVSEEIQRWGTSLASSDGRAKTDATPNGRAAGAENSKPASAASTTSVDGSGNGNRQVNGGSVAPEVWEQAIETCQAKLLHAEEQAMQHRWEQVSLQTKVEGCQRLLAQTDAQLKSLQKRLDTTFQTTTTIETVKDALDKGHDLLLNIDVQGATRIREKFEDAVFVFVIPPSLEKLKERLIARGEDTQTSIQQRLYNVHKEVQEAHWYNYLIINDHFEEASTQLKAIVISERCRMARLQNWISPKQWAVETQDS